MIQYLEMDAADYQPGVCNIGPAEIQRRRRLGYAGLAAAVLLGAALLALDAPAWSRLAVVLPLAAGLSGLIQARQRFCAGFGMAGLRNMGELGAHEAVNDAEARAADRNKALRVEALALAGALAGGLVFALLPA